MTERMNREDSKPQRIYTRIKAENRYPVYDLEDSIAVARTIRDRAGGSASPDQLASFLEYSGRNNGAYLRRMGAAKLFGLIQERGSLLTATPLGSTILAPEHPGEDDRRARVQAFMRVPLYKSLYERYKGGPLPPEAGLRNAMEMHYGMPRAQTQRAYRVLIDSARQAGFFDARGGAPTHLILPLILPNTVEAEQELEEIVDEDGSTVRSESRQASQPQVSMAESDVMKRLRLVLVEKIREIPADNLAAIREYIKEIKELEALEKGGIFE